MLRVEPESPTPAHACLWIHLFIFLSMSFSITVPLLIYINHVTDLIKDQRNLITVTGFIIEITPDAMKNRVTGMV